MAPMRKKLMNMWILTIMCTWDALSVNANRMKQSLDHFLLERQKNTGVAQTSRTDSSVVLRHGRTCSKMGGAILRIGKQESGAIVQSFKPLLG